MTITSKELTCYSDFLMPADFPNYMRHSKFLEYLRLYVDHFRLEQYIRFETEVVSVEQRQDDGGRWSVITRKMKDSSSDAATEIFDAVMVCTGIHSRGNLPTFEGQEEFKGELIHSVNYRQACLRHEFTRPPHLCLCGRINNQLNYESACIEFSNGEA